MTAFVTEQVAGTDRRPLELDVFKPQGQPNGVAVILLHGGGFAQGHRSMMYGYAQALADRGYVAVAAEYRLLGEAGWPAQLDDVRDAVRWVKQNAAKLGIDPTKVALQGYSAGAHLALMVGATQPGSEHEAVFGDSSGTEVGAIVSYFAPAKLDDLPPPALNAPPFSILLKGGGVEAARALSPYAYIHKNFPTTFLIGGTYDFMVDLNYGLKVLQRFVEVGAEVEFHYLHSQFHEFPSTPGMLPDSIDEVAFFYRRTLLDREALAAEARELNIFAKAGSQEGLAKLMAAAQQKH